MKENEKSKITQNNKGFSFVELIIALAISSVVLFALGVFVSQSVRSYRRSTVNAKLETNIDNAMAFGESCVLNASSIRLFKVGDLVYLLSYDSDNNQVGLKYENETLYYIFNQEESFIAGNITDFSVKLNKDMISLTRKDSNSFNLDYVSDYPMLDITISSKLSGQERTINKSFSTRNSCKDKFYLGEGNSESSIDFVKLSTSENQVIPTSLVDSFINR